MLRGDSVYIKSMVTLSGPNWITLEAWVKKGAWAKGAGEFVRNGRVDDPFEIFAKGSVGLLSVIIGLKKAIIGATVNRAVPSVNVVTGS